MRGTPRLEMRGIVRRFPGVVALAGVDFELAEGEVHVLAGENGAGKSTLMRILAGADRSDAGEIRIDGRPVELRSPADALRLGISVVYQELALCAHLTVAENLFLGREPVRRPGWSGRIDVTAMNREAARLLAELGAERIAADRPCGELSLAERQIVEITRALARDVRVLVLDEPTASLPPAEIERLFAALRRLRARGVSIVYISHRMEEYAAIGDRVTVLRGGRVAFRGPVAEASIDTLVRAMAGREVAELFPKEPCPPGDPLLVVEGLSAPRGPSGISFTLRAGEILGVVGLLGSGRSALLRALAGLAQGASGRISVPPAAARGPFRGPAEAIAAGIGFCPEERRAQGLCLGLGVAANLTLASLDRVSRAGVLDAAAEARLAGEAMRALGVRAASAEQPVIELSGGNQQKVVLGRWLLRGARVLLLDEPTRGVDVGAKSEIFRLMVRWAKEGKGIVFVSSQLPEVLGMADRVLVLHRGRLVAERPAAGLTEEEALRIASTGVARAA